MIARDVAGVAVFEADNSALVDGQVTSDYQESGSRFARTYVEADNVDGGYEVERHRVNTQLTWQVHLAGVDASTRHGDLLEATQSGTWLLDVLEDGSSLVWVCDAADEEPPVFYPDGSRTVTLTISAKPRRGY